MCRKKAKKGKQRVIKYEGNNMSQEQMIEIQTEVYYRALKRIEDEKVKSRCVSVVNPTRETRLS